MNFMESIGGGGLSEQEQSEEERIGEDEEDEEGREEAAAKITRNNIISSTSKHQYISNFPNTSSSSDSAPTTSPHHFSYKDFLPRLSQEFTHPRPRTPPPPSGVDLSLGNNSGMAMEEVEKEHMFDKVVTPSDVGKLNRLVIPKQHAEKYFPLDGSSNEKGLLLNFEDRNGKPWRFRYSYWNSSQSYVMTKGWSRFVKDKKLDAGDIVSFQRGAGEDSHHRLFIDWKHRSTVGPPMTYLDFPNVLRGNRLLYSLPHYSLAGYSVQVQPYAGQYNHLYCQGEAPYYVRPAVHLQHQVINAGEGGGISGGEGNDVLPMVIDSVPVVQGRTVGKRLRLFGVNMDCPIEPPSSRSASGYDHQNSHHHHHHHELIRPPPQHLGSSSSSSTSPGASSSLQMGQPGGHKLSKKGKSTSLPFDLGL